jgi:hypothetical protein
MVYDGKSTPTVDKTLIRRRQQAVRPLARSVSKKEHHYVVWVDACFAKFFNQGGNQTFFLVLSVPENTSTSIISHATFACVHTFISI